MQAVINNPHLADWYFTIYKLRNSWLLKILDTEWYWYRFEYQARGSTHAHGCARLTNDPGLCDLVKVAATGWIAQQEQLTISDATSEDYCRLQVQIDDGQTAKQKATSYADWIVTTINKSCPQGRYEHPTPH